MKEQFIILMCFNSFNWHYNLLGVLIYIVWVVLILGILVENCCLKVGRRRYVVTRERESKVFWKPASFHIMEFLSDYDDGMMMCVLLSSMSGEHIISILLGLVFLVEGVNKLPEDQRINVLAQLVE